MATDPADPQDPLHDPTARPGRAPLRPHDRPPGPPAPRGEAEAEADADADADGDAPSDTAADPEGDADHAASRDAERAVPDEDAVAAALAQRVVGGGGALGERRSAQRMREVLHETVESAKAQKDKTVIIVAIVGLAMLIGIVAVVLLNKRQASQPQQVVYTPQFDVGMSSQEEIRSFTSKTAKEVTEIKSEVTELTKSMDGLLKRQNDTESFVRDTMKKASDEFERQGADKVKMMEEYAKSQQAADPRTQSIIDQFRTSLTSLKESPSEAKARAALMLRQAGVAEDRIRNLLAEAAQQAGRISVGDIAEAPLGAEELHALPVWVRPLVPAARDTIYGIATTEGRFYPDQVWNDVKIFLRARAQGHDKEVSDELAKQLAGVARVRRENLPDELQDVLPYLITVRDSQQLAHDDRHGIAHLVWSARDRYPGTSTAGQLLSLCDVVARAIGASAPASGPTATFKPLDAANTTFATQVVASAIWESVQLGKSQTEQYEIANRALTNYLDTTRSTATPEQRKAIIVRAMGDAQQRKEASAPAAPSSTAPAPLPPAVTPAGTAGASANGASAGSPAESGENELFFGPIRLTRGLVQRAVIYIIPGLMAVNGIDPQGAKGAAAMICGIEQVPRLISGELPPYLGKPMGGREFLQAILPEVIAAMHMGQALGAIPVPVSPDKRDEDSRSAQLVRGAVIGAIYGPLVHDEAKAKAVAPDAIQAVEQNPPLISSAVDRLQQVPADQPYAAIITALDIVRPGQFGYPAGRFQQIAESMQQLTSYARQEKDQIQSLFPAGKDGIYEENVRLLIPLALASHDDGQTPLAALSTLVRADINAYTLLFLTEARVSHEIMDAVIPRYAPAVSEEAGGGAALVQFAVEAVPGVIAERFLARSPVVTPDRMADEVGSLTQESLPVVEQRVVQQVVLSRVVPRVQHSGALSDRETLLKAMTHATERATEVVIAPYTPARIDGWASQISDECRAILQGSGPSGPSGKTGPGARGAGYWPPVVMLPVNAGSGQLVGTSTSLVATRQIILPANTYGNAHIQTGVDAEIGGRANIPVMMQIDFDWNGPADSRVVMRGCRLSGVANALAGPERVAIDLKTLSFVFPSGREIDAEVHGYVSDNVHGQYGALGIYKWNAEKVLPMATIAGGFKGAADALKANSTTTIVGAAGTTAVSANQGSELKTAAFGGVAGGFGIMSDYVNNVLQAVHPSVSVVNGQRLSVVLLEPVVLNVPEEEFAELDGAKGRGFSP